MPCRLLVVIPRIHFWSTSHSQSPPSSNSDEKDPVHAEYEESDSELFIAVSVAGTEGEAMRIEVATTGGLHGLPPTSTKKSIMCWGISLQWHPKVTRTCSSLNSHTNKCTNLPSCCRRKKRYPTFFISVNAPSNAAAPSGDIKLHQCRNNFQRNYVAAVPRILVESRRPPIAAACPCGTLPAPLVSNNSSSASHSSCGTHLPPILLMISPPRLHSAHTNPSRPPNLPSPLLPSSTLMHSLRPQLVSLPLATAFRPDRLLAAATAISLELVSPSRSVLTASHRVSAWRSLPRRRAAVVCLGSLCTPVH
ncbi:hypothetical protein PIB30_036650 [Stylosanthes scabra]|uniref:Uncharacterized protein n=1 Tax=Stylosanthes scabra TaxID=79078 RepID=A0ABU6UFG8_9FABA|nr:hypothetical protein [Stylosanthes scabra]